MGREGTGSHLERLGVFAPPLLGKRGPVLELGHLFGWKKPTSFA